MSVASATYQEVYDLYEAVEKAHYAIVRMASGAQMPGAPIADNGDLAAEYDALLEDLETAVAAVNAAGA